MPVLHQLQPSFNNGEISPLLYDRVDYNKFTSSVKSGKNMFVHPQGGMSNRAGTKMLGKAKEGYIDSFYYYAWETNGKIYYTETLNPTVEDSFFDNYPSLNTKTYIVSFDATTQTINWENELGRTGVAIRKSDSDIIKEENVFVNHKVRLIPFEFSNTETYMIEFGNEYCRFYTTNGQVVTEEVLPYEIPSPFKTEDLDKIRYCQSGDVMYIAWGGKPQTLTRYGHTNWVFNEYDFKKGPFEIEKGGVDDHLSVYYNKDEDNYIITSDNYNFSNKDLNRLLKIKKTIVGFHSAGEVSSSSGNYYSSTKLVSGTYEFHTKGTWSGTIKIEYSSDQVNWVSEREFSGYDNINFDFTGEFEEGLWWVRISSVITNGSLTYTFDTQTIVTDVVFKISSIENEHKATGVFLGDIISFSSLFPSDPTGEIVEAIPTMTSNTTPSGEAYSATWGQDAWTFFKDTILSPTKWISPNTSGSLGYKFKKAYYVNKVSFSFVRYDTRNYYANANSFSDAFSNFKMYFSLSGGSKQIISYSITNNIVQNANEFVLNLGGYYLLDDLFFEYTTASPANTKNMTFWKIRAKGIEYVSGETNIDVIDKYAFGVWSDNSFYPTEVDLYQDRIVWTTNNQIDATKISDYTNFGVSSEVTDDDAISVIIKDKKINKINSAIAGSQLVVFTDSGNFIHNNDTFTPSSATFLNQGSTGGANVKPVIVRDNIIYVHPMKQAISDYAYSFETDGYAGQDITILANHLFDNKKIKELAYQQEPYSIIWVLQEEGTMLACTYLRQQNVIAWTPMDFGGKVLSMGVMSNGSNQELYLAIERKNGVFIEKMPYRMLDNDPKERFFVDCGSTYRGEPANIISGLDYLEGESVVALADGYVVKDLVVKNGQITLPSPASIVTVGLPYESVLETLTFDVSQGDGSNLNRKKRVVAVSVRYNNSRGSRISVNGHREVPMLERKIDNVDTDISLKSGFYREILPSAHNEPTTIKIRQDEPLPLTIVSIIPELEYER